MFPFQSRIFSFSLFLFLPYSFFPPDLNTLGDVFISCPFFILNIYNPVRMLQRLRNPSLPHVASVNLTSMVYISPTLMQVLSIGVAKCYLYKMNLNTDCSWIKHVFYTETNLTGSPLVLIAPAP